MDDELQNIVEKWESLDHQAKTVAFPIWQRHPQVGKKRIINANHKTLNRHINWYQMHNIKWDADSYVRRLREHEMFQNWEVLDIDLQALRLGRFIEVARNGYLRVYLIDLQSLLEQIAHYLRAKLEM